MLAVVGAVAIAVLHAQHLAEQRSEAQAQLHTVESLAHELRAITATTSLEGPATIVAQGQGGRTVAELLQAVDRARDLGVDSDALAALERSSDQLMALGTAALTAAARGDDTEALRIRSDELNPSLDAIVAQAEQQRAVEGRRAERATTVARGVLLAGILLGLLVPAIILRRIERASREHRADELLRQQAYTDMLSGLPNRAALELAVEERLRREQSADGDASPVATLALLDLDDLKTINDGLGHGRGDDLIKTIGARIAATVGPDDMVCRFGGDEFGILFADPSEAAAVATMERVLAAVNRPVLVDDRDIRISASAGVAVGNEREALLRDADVAMYAAKARGKDRVIAFDQSMRDNALVNLELTADLRRALARDELFLEFQPIVDLRRGGVDGVEALVRWEHPVRGRVSPLEFIGIAERTGLIGPLGWWVMRTACAQMRTWLDAGLATAEQHVSVNVSPLQLAEPDMARRIARILDDTGLDPRQLQLEITESVLVDEPQALVADLSELMGLGVRIAIDDFGTGHSVLAYLRDLPVDVLKIDKAFIDEIDSDPSRARLTTGIAQLAQALELTIVAEGIETAPQAQILRDMGDMLGQGFLFSRPVPAAVAGKLLRDRRLGPPLSGGLSEVA